MPTLKTRRKLFAFAAEYFDVTFLFGYNIIVDLLQRSALNTLTDNDIVILTLVKTIMCEYVARLKSAQLNAISSKL